MMSAEMSGSGTIYWVSMVLFLAGTVVVAWNILLMMGYFPGFLLIQFQNYGGFRRYYPAQVLVIGIGLVAYALWWSLIDIDVLSLFTFISFTLMPFFLAALWKRVGAMNIRTVLPVWYAYVDAELLQEDQRAVAFAWLRLPRAQKRHYNMNPRHFQVWLEDVVVATARKII